MKRTKNPRITLFLMNVHRVFIEDSGSENHFPLDNFEGYFDFSADFDKKLNEFNQFVLKSDDVDVADGLEKILYAVEISRETYKKHKNDDDFYDYVVADCDYDFLEIKSIYKSWNELYDDEIKNIKNVILKNQKL